MLPRLGENKNHEPWHEAGPRPGFAARAFAFLLDGSASYLMPAGGHFFFPHPMAHQDATHSNRLSTEFLDFISDELAPEVLDTLIDLKFDQHDFIADFLDDIGFDETDLTQYRDASCDFWNDQDKDGHYFCDWCSQIADSQVDIYYYQLWDKAKIFQDWIEEAGSAGLWNENTIKDRGLEGVFMAGQYEFYHTAYAQILGALEKYCQQ